MRGIWRVQRWARDFLAEDRPPSTHDPVAAQLRCLCHGRTDVRPAYAYGVLRAAHTARALGIDEIWVAEMGVAAGQGLLSLARAASIVGEEFRLRVNVVGFDTGGGLPPPADPRDAPFAFVSGDFPMHQDELRRALPSHARLVLGDVATTVPEVMAAATAPLGFVANDLDYYSSTMASLVPILQARHEQLLPRVVMYFDDLIGYPYTIENAEWAAIRDLNEQFPNRPIGLVHGLRWHVGAPFDRQPWPDLIATLEVRDHPRFGTPERDPASALTLSPAT